MITRREFIKTATVLSSASLVSSAGLYAKMSGPKYFALHEFIESHPDAVFILQTNVDAKTNTSAIQNVGKDLGATLFILKNEADNLFPLSAKIVLKPNMTCRGKFQASGRLVYSIEKTMGVQTDSNFIEGLIKSFKNIGVAGSSIYIREVNCYEDFAEGGFIDVAQRTGAQIKNLSDTVMNLNPSDVQWMDVPNGVWYNRIPYLSPVVASDSCLINVAKLKSHSMGITLCAKNLQGTNASPYQRHCRSLDQTLEVDATHVQANAAQTIQANYQQHVAENYPRWTPVGSGSSGALWMETWATRCLDNNSILHPLINIIEGIYGREGPFLQGPDPDGYGIDVMANLVIFGKNAFHVDIVGTYLAGHEPGNFGLFHMAVERNFSKYLNPQSIPLYEWKLDGSAMLTSLDNFTRIPLRTNYLVQNNEPTWHLVNEPFDYPSAIVQRTTSTPAGFLLSQNYPNPFNSSTSIQFSLPSNGFARLEVFDITGQIVDILVDAYVIAGDHLAVWKSGRRATGIYFYRLLSGGYKKTKSMILLK